MSNDREFEAWMNTMEALGTALFGTLGGMHNRNRGYSDQQESRQGPGQGETKREAPRAHPYRSSGDPNEPLFSLRFNLDLFADRLVQNAEAHWTDPRR